MACISIAALLQLIVRHHVIIKDQNCFAICDFNMMFHMTFHYVLSGWDGSALDSTMFIDVRVIDLPVSRGKYYLANTGFPTCDMLLILYQGV